MTDLDDYDGPERRGPERVALSVALEEVRGLKGAVQKLAVAVEESPSREDLVLSARKMREGLFWMAGMLTLFLVFIVVALTVQHSRLEQDVTREYDSVVCLLLVDPAARTAQSLIDCQQGR